MGKRFKKRGYNVAYKIKMLEAWKRNSYTAAHLKEVTKTKPCEFGPDGMPVLTREELFDS